mgnify:CR=1 FL=1
MRRAMKMPASIPSRSRARNIAIAAANSALVAFLDADDQWWPGKLLKQISWHHEHPEAGMSFTDFIQSLVTTTGPSAPFNACVT